MRNPIDEVFGTKPTIQQKNLDRIAGPAATPSPAHRTPFSFKIPPKDDPSILLGNRYLNRGDGMVVVSSSGMGKSSLSHQMSADWALGLPFFGIKSNGSLKILIVQSEDSDGDIAEVWESIKHVRQFTDDQISQLNSNIRIISQKSLRGVKFLNWLRKEIDDFGPDLVILNPLQAYIDGDVTDSKDLGFFLREGLNGMNPTSPNTKPFGWIIIHHTTKPSTGKDRSERQWHEVMYDMAGGAEIINWARGIISLRATEEPGKFKAILAKRGRRAGVTKEVEQGAGGRHEIVTQFGLQHSSGFLPNTDTGIIYWEPYTLPSDEPRKPVPSGRSVKHSFTDVSSVFPKKQSPGLSLNELHRAIETCVPITRNTLHGVLKRWAEENHIEIIKEDGKPMRYRAMV